MPDDDIAARLREEAGEPCRCDGGWTHDEGWMPVRSNQVRKPRDGLIPCGFCNLGGWDAPWPPAGPLPDPHRDLLLAAADLIDSLRADNARLTRQLAFDPAHARLTAAAVAIEDAGVLPEGWTVGPYGRVGVLRLTDETGAVAATVTTDNRIGCCWCPGKVGFWSEAYDTPVEAAVAAIAATAEGAT